MKKEQRLDEWWIKNKKYLRKDKKKINDWVITHDKTFL